MRVLLVHPSPLMYSEVYLKLEPLGLERVAQALRAAGHDVRLLDLQIFGHRDYVRELDTFRPRAVGFSLNYLANVPEVLDLAVATRSRRPDTFIFAGGHSASFINGELLQHAGGALDCLVRGEAEVTPPRARHRHRPRDRAARYPQGVLPGDPLRRPRPEPRGFRVLEASGPAVHVPRAGGARRGGAQAPQKARDAGRELPGARDRARARLHRRRQHHRRSRL